jgi:hypothetical protein
MPDYWPRIHRPANGEHEEEIRSWREAIARSLKILDQSEPPDTFLGRRTQEPFPSEGTKK